MTKELTSILELEVEYKDSPKFQSTQSTIKHVANFIPIIGGCLSSILADIQQERHFERYSEFVNSVFCDIDRRIDELNKTKISSNEFLDLLELGLKSSITNSNAGKRSAIQSIVFNSMIDFDFSIGDAEYIMGIIIKLPVRHLLVIVGLSKLAVIKNPDSEAIKSMADSLVTQAQIDKFELRDILTDLQNEGVSISFKSMHDMYSNGEGFLIDPGLSYLTSKGEKLIDAIFAHPICKV
ncbi:MAG: hypothetical protein IPO40_23645 [Fibrobacteres bacterium]|nr:hypothetical protein [Fibrobacterota bacterium]